MTRLVRDIRKDVIEECARFLEKNYPENVNTNAFCAALRSLKSAEGKQR